MEKHQHDHGTCCHHEENKRLFIARLIVSVFLWAISNFVLTNYLQLIGFLLAYIVIGYDVLYRALKGLLHLEFTNEQLLMSLVSLASIFLNEAEEAVMVMFLYQLGEFLSDIAVDKSKESIEQLLSVDEASNFDSNPNQSKTESMVNRFAHIYTPIVIVLAIVVLVGSMLLFSKSFTESLQLACTMLAISCPCALVISIPLAYYCGMGNAYKKRIVIKNAQVLENVAKGKTKINYIDKKDNSLIKNSDVLVLDKEVKENEVKRICQKTMRIVLENVSFIIICKVFFLIISALGKVTMALAVFADVGVTLITVLNSSRASSNIIK